MGHQSPIAGVQIRIIRCHNGATRQAIAGAQFGSPLQTKNQIRSATTLTNKHVTMANKPSHA